MLPYLEPPTWGPITSFGVLAMVGLGFAITASWRHGEKLGLDPARLHGMAIHCGIGAVLGAHYVDLFLYQPGWSAQPDAVWRFVNPFAGISSYGGLLGGTLGFLVFAHRNRIARLRFADVGALGVVVFLVFGRAGCASVHDHVGVATDFALAVDFPAGNPAGVVGPHHDLGLYEMALWLVLLAISIIMLRTPRPAGWYVGFVAVGYAVPRFFLDLLRPATSDPRYAGLTPAQWGCIATVLAGLAVFAWIVTHRERPQPYLCATPWRVHLRELVRWRPRPG